MRRSDSGQDRVERLFALKQLGGLVAVLVTRQPDVFYFTGFTGDDSWAVLTRRKSTIVTDGRYSCQAREESPQARVVVRRGGMVDSVVKVLTRSAIRRIGFVREDVSVGLIERLTAARKGIKWRGVSSECILDLRAIKSAGELRAIRKAISIAEKSFDGLLGELKVGISESQIAAMLDHRMRLGGARGSAFETIVAYGGNSARPHAQSGRTKVREGRPIVIDFGAKVGQYCCDLTRTVWLSRMSRRFEKIYELCLAAQLEAISVIKAGAAVRDVDNSARKVIRAGGYGRYFVHGLGHGVGLEVHELPIVSGRGGGVLCEGMVITVEPGIYVPGVGGVRIEDDVLVTKNGCRVLSKLAKGVSDVVLR